MENDTPQKRVKARERQRRKRAKDQGIDENFGRYRPKPRRSPSDSSSHDSEIQVEISENVSSLTTSEIEYEVEAPTATASELSSDAADPVPSPQPPPQPSPDPDPGSDPDTSSTEEGSTPDENGGANNNLGENTVNIPINAEWFANRLLKIKLQSDVSNAAIQKMLDVFLPHMTEISNLFEDGHISRNFRHGILPKAGCTVPKIRCGAKILKNNPDGSVEIYIKNDLKVIPRKYLSSTSSRFVLLSQSAYTTLAEMKIQFEKLHPKFSRNELTEIYSNAYLGIDGVRESEHGSRTLIAITLMLAGCIMLWKILNPMQGVPSAKPDAEELLGPLVDEINNDLEIIVRRVICDMVERHHVKGMKGHMAHNGCEICEAPGNGPAGRIDYDYPRSTKFGLRTNTRWRNVVRRLQRNERVNRRGIKQHSPLLDLQYPFDIVWDVPVEEFHMLKEGLTKQMLVKIFTGTSVMAKEITQKFCEIYTQTQVFSETPRRTRRVAHIKKFKGSEFGVLMFTGLVPLFKECFPENCNDYWLNVKKCLAVYAFLTRLYFYDEATYREILATIDTRKCHQTFYRTFEKCFCTYYNKGVNPNAHLFWHLPLIREHSGPLWKTSTEPSEAFYSKFPRCSRKGTPNVPAQIMKAAYQADSIDHRCRNNFVMRVNEWGDGNKTKYCDSFVTDNTGAFWQVMEDVDGESFVCAAVKTCEIYTGVGLGVGMPLPWSKVGVKMYEGIDYAQVKLLHRKDLRGKFMKCSSYVLEWLPEWFRDSKKNY